MQRTGIASPTEPTIIFNREFDAPRDLVWQAWTDPKHIVHWWGPNGFTNTIHAMDVRPGGVWRFIMHGPDGTDYPNKIIYREVVKPERLVYDHSGDDNPDDPHVFQVLVTFADTKQCVRIRGDGRRGPDTRQAGSLHQRTSSIVERESNNVFIR
jgi:uncharacterized protein YndB with AHSA1/START domain